MEKKNKRKFWGTLTSFLLTFMFISSWAVLGVALALRSAKVDVGGNISFTTAEVQATVTLTEIKGNAKTDNTADNCKTITINKNNNGAAEIATWTGLALHFVNDSETESEVAGPVTITFVIKNTNASKKMDVVFGDLVQGTKTSNAAMAVTAGGKDVSVAENKTQTLAAQEELTVVITFTVEDKDLDAELTGWLVPITLNNVQAAA